MAWLITGTSSGFGLALAQHVLRNGLSLVSLSRHATPHHSLPTENLYHIQHDLADPNPKALKTKIREFFSAHPEVTVDVLVNNAAISNFHPLETFDDSEFARAMTVNFYSPLWAIQAVLPHLRAQTSAKVIVNVSSTQGLTCDPSEGAYDASKHALEGMSGVLAKEVGVFGVRVVVVNLGSFRTSFALGDKQSTSETFNGWDGAYLDSNHPAKKRVDMVTKYASMPNAARGDVGKGAAAVFDAVATAGSVAYKALKKQREAMEGNPVSMVERLVLGSDAMPKLEKQAKCFEVQLETCKEVSASVEADDLKKG